MEECKEEIKDFPDHAVTDEEVEGFGKLPEVVREHLDEQDGVRWKVTRNSREQLHPLLFPLPDEDLKLCTDNGIHTVAELFTLKACEVRELDAARALYLKSSPNFTLDLDVSDILLTTWSVMEEDEPLIPLIREAISLIDTIEILISKNCYDPMIRSRVYDVWKLFGLEAQKKIHEWENSARNGMRKLDDGIWNFVIGEMNEIHSEFKKVAVRDTSQIDGMFDLLNYTVSKIAVVEVRGED